MFTVLLALLLCTGAGAIGGVFFGFSSFVMRSLADLPAEAGIAAMQRINVVVLNPSFLGVFMGTAVVCVAAAGFALMSWTQAGSAWLLAASLLYGVGCFGATMAFNVPRNERLARLAATSPEARAYWPVYVREWTFWNHVRSVAALAACACAAWALKLIA